MSKVANFPTPRVLGAPVGGDPTEFRIFGMRKLFAVYVCVMTRLAALTELRLVTDRQTNRQRNNPYTIHRTVTACPSTFRSS